MLFCYFVRFKLKLKPKTKTQTKTKKLKKLPPQTHYETFYKYLQHLKSCRINFKFTTARITYFTAILIIDFHPIEVIFEKIAMSLCLKTKTNKKQNKTKTKPKVQNVLTITFFKKTFKT